MHLMLNANSHEISTNDFEATMHYESNIILINFDNFKDFKNN